MKYVALLSGGKDSCYNLLHCQKNGHELVAAASLRPETGKDEIDSYMYQTVGHDAIELVAQALDVPLYRRIILGDAIQQSSEYGARNGKDVGGVKGDETEDLYELLLQVLEHHPDVKGVSVGAILSNYQRVRVEHVCRRLGLVPLCYLWQRDQAELLAEMIDAGLTAVLIKVAGIGLTVKHLGKTLAEMQPTFTKLNSLYGSHVCGEGGEYESLTIDCPIFKSRIILEEVETVIHSDNGFATVAYLRIKKGVLAPKTDEEFEDVTIPPLLEEHFRDEEQRVDHSNPRLEPIKASYMEYSSTTAELRSLQSGNWVAVSNVQRSLPEGSEVEQKMSLEDEVTECFTKIENELAKFNLSLENCANINVFLSSMDLFVEVNNIYTRFFGVSPPARACVAAYLPTPIRVRLEVTAFSETTPSERQALHVQGLSYWAPANIGPYSQAILASDQLFVSGQVGLIPSSLNLADAFPTQVALSHQHASRVSKAISETSGGWTPIPQLIVHWLDQRMEPCDVLFTSDDEKISIPSLAVVVEALPKNARIEKQALYHTGRWRHEDEDGEEVVETTSPTYYRTMTSSAGGAISVEHVRNADGSYVAMICANGPVAERDLNSLISEYTPTSKPALSARVFHVPNPHSVRMNQSVLCGKTLTVPTTYIACKHIASACGPDWDYVVVIYSPQNNAA